jgi:hypothetical protein
MSPKRKITRQCLHANTVLSTSGSLSFCNGSVNDDLKTFEVCLDCGRTVRRQRKPKTLTGRQGVPFGFRDLVTREYSQGVDF